MKTDKFFWVDPYLKELEAKVVSVEDNLIALDKTILFSFSGGQQSDSGTINGYKVLGSHIVGKQIFYEIEPNNNFKVGDSVLIKLDWEKRYNIMRLHFAAELILELVYQDYSHPEKIGANITSDKARVDFFWEGNISDIFQELQKKFDVIVSQNYKIISDFSDIESELRYWQIQGFAKVPCGGTHIKSTAEIGKINLKRVNTGSGKERIEITLLPDLEQ